MLWIGQRNEIGKVRVANLLQHDLVRAKSAESFQDGLIGRGESACNFVFMNQGDPTQVFPDQPFSLPLVRCLFSAEINEAIVRAYRGCRNSGSYFIHFSFPHKSLRFQYRACDTKPPADVAACWTYS